MNNLRKRFHLYCLIAGIPILLLLTYINLILFLHASTTELFISLAISSLGYATWTYMIVVSIKYYVSLFKQRGNAVTR